MVSYKRVYHWDGSAGGRCKRSYSERRCHGLIVGLPGENTVNLLTCKTHCSDSLSHLWIWSTCRLSSGRLSHHGRFSERDQRVQNLFYAASHTTIMGERLGVLSSREDCRHPGLYLTVPSALEKTTRAEQHVLRLASLYDRHFWGVLACFAEVKSSSLVTNKTKMWAWAAPNSCDGWRCCLMRWNLFGFFFIGSLKTK